MLKSIVVVSFLTLSAPSFAGDAQSPYPIKPVRFVVPFAPGGSSDIQARIISQKLTERWGVGVIVDNRPSAGGIAASDIVAHAGADGHTLLLGHVGTHAFNPHLYKSLPYDTDRAFAPVTMTLTQPLVLVTAAGSPLQSVQMLIDTAKAAPGKLNYASAGIGSPNHLAAELFRTMSGASMAHVPFKGAVPAEIDTIAGRVDVFFDSMLSAIPLVRSKQLRALAVTSAQRSSTLPATPTISEAGVRGYDMQTWNGVFVPAGTPPRVIAALNAAIADTLRMPDVKSRLEGDGARLVGDTSAQFDAYVRAERAKWGEVIRRGNIQAQ